MLVKVPDEKFSSPNKARHKLKVFINEIKGTVNTLY